MTKGKLEVVDNEFDFMEYVIREIPIESRWVDMWVEHHQSVMQTYKRRRLQIDLDTALECLQKSIVCNEIIIWRKHCQID